MTSRLTGSSLHHQHVGGLDAGWRAGFLEALREVDAAMVVIEHQDQEIDQIEGLRYAEELLQAAVRGPVAEVTL